MNRIGVSLIGVFLAAVITLTIHPPVTEAQAPVVPKEKDAPAQLEKRLANIEKILLEMQSALKAKQLPEVISDGGTTWVIDKEGTDVYYRIPFNSPPQLTFWDSGEGKVAEGEAYWVTVVEQKADHFRVKNRHPVSGMRVRWKAEGVAAQQPRKPAREERVAPPPVPERR